VEVTLVLDVNLLISGLKSFNQHFGSSQPSGNFNNIRNYYPQSEIRVVGTGAISSKEFPEFIGWDRVAPQGKLMAKRGAQVDASRNLAEAILGVQIAANTTVQDFVTQRDEIVAKMRGIISGVQYGTPEYLPSGVVRLRGWVSYHAVHANQQKLYNVYPQYRPVQYQTGMVEVYGFGVCPPRFYRYQPITPPPPPPPPPPVEPQGPQNPNWVGQTHKVTGTGAVPENALNPAQGRLMARRAAYLDGYRQMLEYVQGLRIDSETKVKDFVTEYDTVKSQVNGWIRGVRPVAERFNPDGTYEVDFVLDLSKAWNIVQPYKKD
jgi:hypothetical protein